MSESNENSPMDYQNKKEKQKVNEGSKKVSTYKSFGCFIILIILSVLIIVYYFKILEKNKNHFDLTLFESFYLGFGRIFIIFFGIIILFGLIGTIFSNIKSK